MAEAIPLFEQIVRLSPQQAAAHHNLGVAYLGARRPAAALAAFQRAVALKPASAEAHFNLGLALEGLGRADEAVAALRKAVEIKPRMAVAHQRIGDLLRIQGHEADAVQAYRRAAAAAPETTLGRYCKARMLIAQRKPGEAEACLRRAIVADPKAGDLHWMLATVLGEGGRFEEAEASFRRTMELQPDRVEVYRDFLLSKKLTAADRPLLAQMIEAVRRAGPAGAARMDALFAIAKGYDDLGDYEAAMRHFDEANAFRGRGAAFDREARIRRTDEIIAGFPADLLARAEALGDPDPRPVFVLGMPRSGTTLVEQILSCHPQVAGGGELHFWLSHGRQLDRGELAEGAVRSVAALARDYRAELDRISPSALRVTDKNPYNYEWIGLIRLAFPNARFIYCSRHPVDTALSIYTTPFATRTDYAGDRGHIVFVYRQHLRLMDHWRAGLPPEALFEAPYEAIVADPDTWSRALVRFCGLDWDDACLRPEANPRVVRTASLWQTRQPIYSGSVERWRRYEPWLGELRELLPAGG